MKVAPIASTLAAAALISGCGGGGEGSRAGNPADPGPRIASPAAIVINQDTSSAPITLRVFDSQGPPEDLEISIDTSDPTVVPLDGVRVTGDGAQRTLIVRPSAAAVGESTLTATVRDRAGRSSAARIAVRVQPVLVSFRDLAGSAFDLDEQGPPLRLNGITLQQDADADPTAFQAQLR